MVLWCKSCNALIGLREPFTNWSEDRSALCTSCMVTKTDAQQINLEDSAVYDSLQSTESDTPTSKS